MFSILSKTRKEKKRRHENFGYEHVSFLLWFLLVGYDYATIQ